MDRMGRERLPAGWMESKGEGGECFKWGLSWVKAKELPAGW